MKITQQPDPASNDDFAYASGAYGAGWRHAFAREAWCSEEFRPGKAAFVLFENSYIEELDAEDRAYLGLHGEVAGVVGSADHGGCYTGAFKGGIDEQCAQSLPDDDNPIAVIGWRPRT